jgi:hypothetical protein
LTLGLAALFGGIDVGVIYGTWAFAPTKYSLTDKEIIIRRPAKDLVIPLSELTKVEKKDIKVFKTIRTAGNGGLFAFTGSFYNKADGTFWMYCKNKNYVMLHGKKKYVLSPDDKELFITDISAKMEKIKKNK